MPWRVHFPRKLPSPLPRSWACGSGRAQWPKYNLGWAAVPGQDEEGGRAVSCPCSAWASCVTFLCSLTAWAQSKENVAYTMFLISATMPDPGSPQTLLTLVWIWIFFFPQTGSHAVAQADPERIMYSRLAINYKSFCLPFLMFQVLLRHSLM